MSNRRELKAFVRYDQMGRAIASTLVLRKTMPKVGNWKEVKGYLCCEPTTTVV